MLGKRLVGFQAKAVYFLQYRANKPGQFPRFTKQFCWTLQEIPLSYFSAIRIFVFRKSSILNPRGGIYNRKLPQMDFFLSYILECSLFLDQGRNSLNLGNKFYVVRERLSCIYERKEIRKLKYITFLDCFGKK